MNVVRVGVSPWMHMNPGCLSNPTSDCKAGVELDILHIIASLSNLTLSIVVTNHTGCGKPPTTGHNGNSTGDGLLQMLRDGEIDMIGNFCNTRKLANYNQSFYSLSPPVWQYHEIFVIQTPKPGALSFRPFAPFDDSVWIACFLTYILYLVLVSFYHFVHYKPKSKLVEHVKRAQGELRRICFGNYERITSRFTIWPLWLIFLTFMFMFYKTYILSTVLHPFPILQPFSNAKELALALRKGQYRVISHKKWPAPPAACLGKKCELIFEKALMKWGVEYVPGAGGDQLLAMIANQHPKDTPKYVMIQGQPFIQLYFRRFRQQRNRLWLLDGEGVEAWASFVWKKDFKYAERFNRHLAGMGDFTSHALTRYLQLYGPEPYTGERFVPKTGPQEAIGLTRIRALFYVNAVGTMAAVPIYFIEIIYAKLQCAGYDVRRMQGLWKW